MVWFKVNPKRESGQALAEYLILVAAVSTAMLGVAWLFGNHVQQYLSFVEDLLSKPF